MKQTKGIAILLSGLVLTTFAVENSEDHLDQLGPTNNNEATTDLLGSLCGTSLSTGALISSYICGGPFLQVISSGILVYHLYNTKKNYHRIKDLQALKKN